MEAGEGSDARHASEGVDCCKSAVASARAAPRQLRSSSKSPQRSFIDDRLTKRTTLVPRPRHPHQVSEREVVAPQAIYRADQAKAPEAVAQLASVPVPAAVEELLETNQALVSEADLLV